jgi:hypothetical protein
MSLSFILRISPLLKKMFNKLTGMNMGRELRRRAGLRAGQAGELPPPETDMPLEISRPAPKRMTRLLPPEKDPRNIDNMDFLSGHHRSPQRQRDFAKSLKGPVNLSEKNGGSRGGISRIMMDPSSVLRSVSSKESFEEEK